MNIGFLGLGKLGLPCALAIESKGHTVCGYDPKESVAEIVRSRTIPYKEVAAQDLLAKSDIAVSSSGLAAAESRRVPANRAGQGGCVDPSVAVGCAPGGLRPPHRWPLRRARGRDRRGR